MRPLTKYAVVTLLILLSSQLLSLAQPRLPEGKMGSSSREAFDIKPSAQTFNADIDLGSFSVDTESRAEVRAFFKAIYFASEGVDMGWTGDYAEANAATAKGDTSDAYKEAVLLRINFFRAMAGIPAAVTLDEDYNTQAQAAALTMSGSDQLSHTPIAHTFPNYVTTEADTAASESNIAIGSAGPDAVDGYMQDKGAGNAAVGHRRWLINPPSVVMGTGDVPGGSAPQSIYDAVFARFGYTPTELRRANAIHVFDSQNTGGPHPQTAYPYVAYPQKGYVPYHLVYPRWSFSIDGANFSGASVSMTRDGNPINVSLETYQTGFGDNTLVWVYDGLDASITQSHPRPNQDTVYEVTVSGITGATEPSYTYQVTVIDPDVAGNGEIETLLTGSPAPTVNIENLYKINDPEFNSGFRWRVFQKGDFSGTEGAESGLGQLQANLSPGLNPIYSGGDVASGGSAFHLVQTEGNTDQTITFPQTFVGASDSSLSFASQLQWATATQFAKVQISFDEGISWQDIFSQAGTGGGGENSYDTENIVLDVDGKTFQIRFAYTHEGGTFFPQSDSNVGWLFDDIIFSNVDIVTNETLNPHQNSSDFNFTPAQEASYCLQAQGMLFQNYPMEWGPITEVTASADNLEPGAGDDFSTIYSNTDSSSGNVLDNDDDPNNDTLSVTQVNASGGNVGADIDLNFGTVNIASNGAFTYDLTTSQTEVFELLIGETLQDSITYQLSDGKGGTDTATLTITIRGSYEAPLLFFTRTTGGATIEWTEKAGVTYTLQSGSTYLDWADDNRTITPSGSKRTISVSNAEIAAEILIRVRATRP